MAISLLLIGAVMVCLPQVSGQQAEGATKPTYNAEANAASSWWEVAGQIPAATQAAVLRLGKKIRHTRLDCSHLVHELYQHAGLPYPYANSVELYDGMSDFRQIDQPAPADIIVWRGHMGVVVDPSAHSFLSSLRSGVKISNYDSGYWKNRGVARFFRYVGENTVQLRTAERLARNRVARSAGAGD